MKENIVIILKRMPVILAAAYFVTGILLYVFQKNFIFFPTPVSGIPLKRGIKEIIVDNTAAPESYKIRVLAVEEKQNKKALIYFGGNAEAVLYSALELQGRISEYNIYFMKYRGYSGASGEPGEDEIFSDALALYDYLKEKYEEISVMGRSLGTGVACYTASKREVEKLVLVTPYDSIMNIAQARFPVYPMSILLKHKFDSLSYAGDCVKNVKKGIMAVMVKGDAVVSNINTQKLVSEFEKMIELKAGENGAVPKTGRPFKSKYVLKLEMKIISGTDHNSLSDRPEYYEWLKEFFNE